LCCGSLYAWSGFNGPIETYIYGPNGGTDRAIAVNTFYIAVAVFGCMAAILGPWLERNGPFRGAILGAGLFFFGNLMTALGVYVKQISIVYIGYGLFSGGGLGIAYIAPVSPLQKWFPELRGLAAGFAVCGFGGGSIIAPYTQKLLIGTNYATDPSAVNLGVPLTFVILGACYFVLMLLGGAVLRMPPPGYAIKGITIDTVKGAESLDESMVGKGADPETKSSQITLQVEDIGSKAKTLSSHFSMTLIEALFSVEMRLMYGMFFCSQITGLLIISKIQSITHTQLGKSNDEAVLINSLLGGSNLLGRLCLPLISDLIGSRKLLFIISCTVQAILLGFLPQSIAAQSYWSFLLEVNVIAFFYGGGFGMIPAFLSDQFGSKNIGPTHGVILTAWAIAGVCGGLVFTAVYTQIHNSVFYLAEGEKAKAYHPSDAKFHEYDTNFHWILAFVCVGAVLASLVPSNLRDRRLPKAPGETFRFRLGSRLVRVIGLRPVFISKGQEDQEWAAYLEEVTARNNGRN
ncbi:hypothetical protein HDU76_003316, partial [Blyttiomyces sp. JEL0837]